MENTSTISLRSTEQPAPGQWLPITAGLTAAVAYVTVATWLTLKLEFAHFPEVQYVCSHLGLAEDACRSGAISAGLHSYAGLAGTAVITFLLYVFRRASPQRELPEIAYLATAIMAAAICGTHALREFVAPTMGRQDAFGAMAALENLLWPLLVQLFAMAATNRQRALSGSALLLIAALSPFRGVIFATALFAGIVPLCAYLYAFPARWKAAYGGMALSLVLASLCAILFLQTTERLGSSDSTIALRALTQRIVMPLFQAEATETLRDDLEMPTMADNIRGKLRLSSSPNLNQYLYRRVYGDGRGETTALFYGEAVANFKTPPEVWIATAALIPVLLALGFGAVGINVTTLCALALWRGSMGGLSDVVPALAIQLAALSLLYLAPVGRWRKAYLLAAAGITVAALAHLTLTWMASGHVRAISSFKINATAKDALTSCGNIATIADEAAASKGELDGAVATTVEIFQNTLGIQLGTLKPEKDDRYRLFMRIENGLSAMAERCNGTPRGSIVFEVSSIERANKPAPLDFAAVAGALGALLYGFRRKTTNRGLLALHDLAQTEPLQRIGVLGAAVTMLSLGALLSLSDERMAVVWCIATLAGTALTSARASLLLTIAIVPFSYVFGLSGSSIGIIVAAAIAFTAACALFERPQLYRDLIASPYGLVLAAFAVLLTLHLADTSLDSLRGAAFMACAVVIFLGVRFIWAQEALSIAQCMTASVLIGCVISLAFLHGPIEWLVAKHPRLDNLRLAGIFDEANAAGRFLIPVFFYGVLRARDRTTPLGLGSVALIATCLAATMSKGTLFAIALASVLLLVLEPRKALRSAVLLGFAVAVMAAWIFTINPPLQTRAARIWDSISSPSETVARLTKTPESQTAADVIAQDLRVGTSSQMMTTKSGEIKYIDRPYSLWHTGQRDILWTNGAAVIAVHPLWGLGYHRWKPELMERTGYPFISPHNGLLEVMGAYGIAGATLYLLLALWLVPRAFVRASRMIASGKTDTTLAWATISTVAMLIFELTDVSTSLAATLPAIWFWTLLAIQESRLASGI